MKHLPDSRLDFESLRSQLKAKSQASNLLLRQKFPHVGKLLASGMLATNLLLPSGPKTLMPPPVHAVALSKQVADLIDSSMVKQYFIKTLNETLPPVGNWQLNAIQEKIISGAIFKTYGISVVPTLEGNRLNNSYGRMGAEQHLARFPGDVVENMAPGLGGWGYVSDFEVEKYYVAVQTLYLPDWNTRTKYLSNWYKFRRMVAVNPANGKAMVVAVADAGPANWTGKHFGGSPEVMNYLGIDYGMQNHPVVLFFLDDPNHEVPLGPVEYNREDNKKALKNQA